MKNIQELFERVKNNENRLGVSQHGAWFRGHYDRTWVLAPKLLRYSNGMKHERNIFSTFCTEAPINREEIRDDIQILSRMQHYGIPTRLLDWTSSLNTALFFATIFPLKRQVGNPCVWIMNPFKLNKISANREIIFDNTDVLTDASGHTIKYFESIRDKTWPFKLPVASYSTFTNDRIKAQRGAFTIHGNLDAPLEILAPKALKRIDIPHHLVAKIRDHFTDIRGIFSHFVSRSRWTG